MSKDRRPHSQAVDLLGLQVSEDRWLSVATGISCYNVRTPNESVADQAHLTHANSLYTARIEVSDTASLLNLIHRGFRLVDTAITLRSDPSTKSDARRHEDFAISIASARNSDLPAIESIALSAFHLSRFHLDPHFPNAIASDLKRQWARNLALGKRGDGCLVARKEGHIVGFLGFVSNDLGDVAIDLIAVEQATWGKGVGASMVAALQSTVHERHSVVFAGTQIINRRAMRLYESLGFRFDSAAYVMHGNTGYAAANT